MSTESIWQAVTRTPRDWTLEEIRRIESDPQLQRELMAWYETTQSDGCWTRENQTRLKQWQIPPEPEDILERYIALRSSLVELEDLRRRLEPQVADIGLEARSRIGNSKFYRSKSAELSVVFRTQKPKVAGNADLENLQEDIELEALKAQWQNAREIALLTRQLERLQRRIERLSQTDRGRTYQREFDELVARLTVAVPQVKVHLR